MKKSFMTRLFMALLIFFAFLLFACNYNVKASNIENTEETLEELLNSEDKIMKYDAITGETTEVNMEELKQALANSKDASKSTSNVSEAKLTQQDVYQPKVAFNLQLRLRFWEFC